MLLSFFVVNFAIAEDQREAETNQLIKDLNKLSPKDVDQHIKIYTRLVYLNPTYPEFKQKLDYYKRLKIKNTRRNNIAKVNDTLPLDYKLKKYTIIDKSVSKYSDSSPDKMVAFWKVKTVNPIPDRELALFIRQVFQDMRNKHRNTKGIYEYDVSYLGTYWTCLAHTLDIKRIN